MTTRTYNARPISHEEILVPFYVGGTGYVNTPMVKVWNPANPDRWIVLTPEDFDAITAPAIAQAA